MQLQWDHQCPAPLLQAWDNLPRGCGAPQLCKQTTDGPEKEGEKGGLHFQMMIWRLQNVTTDGSFFYLDHVEMILIGESSVHVTVQLFKGPLDGVNSDVFISILTNEMVACKIK